VGGVDGDAPAIPPILAESPDPAIPTLRQWAALDQSARDRIAALEHLALQAGELAQMDYDFLFDEGRHLLAIGYNVSERRRDASYYDLLASEARLCSLWPSLRGRCLRRTGSLWGAC
jgi:cyclic beta-1,2-glucan synthetase